MRRFLAAVLAAVGLGNAANANDVEQGFVPNDEANRHVVQALLKQGSDPNKPHPIEHHFYCDSEATLKQLMAKGERLGYRAAHLGDDVDEDDGTPYWYGDLIKPTVLDIDTLNADNVEMLKLADEFGADYDGWGTEIVE